MRNHRPISPTAPVPALRHPASGPPARLLPHQRRAVGFVRAAASAAAFGRTGNGHPAERPCEPDREAYARLARRIADGSPVDVHFHPDRIAANGLGVVEALATSPLYENQFVTGISNGGLDGAMSGRRRRWESRMFGAAYDGHPDRDRPKYGGLNLFDTGDGACPRFGSCYLRLRPETRARCTLSYGDSHVEPAARGTPDAPAPLLAALARDFADAAGRSAPDASVVRHLRRLHGGSDEPVAVPLGRILDGYVEVQLHGELSLRADVLHICADSAFRGSATGAALGDLADACGIGLVWRPALRLPPGPLPVAFRGETLTAFVESIRVAGRIDAARLGDVARSVVSEPAAWSSWGAPSDVLQLLKQSWHAIVAFGELDDACAVGAGG